VVGHYRTAPKRPSSILDCSCSRPTRMVHTMVRRIVAALREAHLCDCGSHHWQRDSLDCCCSWKSLDP
jgi:hypothetical protein